MDLIQEISEYLQKGRAKNVKQLVQQALDENMDPKAILNDGLLSGMMIIGAKFKNNEVFVPEVLVAARAMNVGLSVLEPKLIEVGNEPVGKAVIGTVQGDLHDIGKNLVVMMLKGAGFEIYDLGVDVETSVYIDKAEEVGADIICMSALLTTTMPKMQDCIEQLKERGLRDKYIVMIGGAPVNESFCEQIGADYYTPDAASCAEVAKKVVQRKLKRKKETGENPVQAYPCCKQGRRIKNHCPSRKLFFIKSFSCFQGKCGIGYGLGGGGSEEDRFYNKNFD